LVTVNKQTNGANDALNNNTLWCIINNVNNTLLMYYKLNNNKLKINAILTQGN